MTTLRRILASAVVLVGASSLAHADLILGYSTTIGPTSTDITNVLVNLPSFNPGGSTAEDLIASNVSHAGSNYTAGISMASLNNPGLIYTLVGYDITISEVLSGSYSITNTSTNSTATGNAFIDTYNAVALNSPLSPPLSNVLDPTNDLFNYSRTGIGINPPSGPAGQPGEQNSSIGGGPDPAGDNTGSFTLAPGQSTPSINITPGTGSPFVDYGAELIANSNGDCQAHSLYNWALDCTDANVYNSYNNGYFVPVGTGANVVSPADLAFYLSTITQTDQQVTGGNLTSAYSLNVQDTITVSYDIYVTSTAPEPTTMALFGGALLGLGLLGKRIRKG
ncbi:MAG TPA: PEP-CTERM sorting domain-containing protein [Bryobacteraceae bacterium]|nr:PEP-CTERM sorting domain-containing protein [Bryobacteraceae bacterium]